jgi:hypothetical protein
MIRGLSIAYPIEAFNWIIRGVASILFLAQTVLWAFPPAPAITYYGTARDAFGNAIDSSAGGFVLIKEGNRIIAEAPIDERMRPGENFRVLIPVDLESLDPYSPNALNRGDLISLAVRLPSGEYPVAGISTQAIELSDPGDRIQLDFFLGEDTDGDGLPDTWEYSQLEAADIFAPDPRYSLETLDRGGDVDGDGMSNGDEYVAGTFALLQSDTFTLRFLSPGTEADELRTGFVFGKYYRLEASRDLVEWNPVRIRLSGSQGEGALELQSTRDGPTDFEAIRPDDLPEGAQLFYRLRVR